MPCRHCLGRLIGASGRNGCLSATQHGLFPHLPQPIASSSRYLSSSSSTAAQWISSPQSSRNSAGGSLNSKTHGIIPNRSFQVAGRVSGAAAQPLTLVATRRYATIMPTNFSDTSSPPPLSTSRTKLKVTPPSLSAIKEEGYMDDDVELLPESEAWLNITEDSVKQLEKITSREPPEVLAKGLALRVGVDSGGCHGYQYTMALTEERGVDDYVMQPENVNCIPVVVDLISLRLLKGATLHHATELIGSSFQLKDNPQAKQGGSCGCGVSWEAKEDI